jgi:integrase
MMQTTVDKPKQKRRGNGEGTVFQRGGKWAGVVTVGRDENGKLIRRWVRGDTKTAVTNRMTELRKQKLDGVLVRATKTTVAEWLVHWLANIAPFDKKPCRATTIVGHKKTARLYVNPHVGGFALSKLTHSNIEAMHGALRLAGIGQGTIRVAHSVLRRALAVAVVKGLIIINPCDRAGRPGPSKSEMQSLSVEQAGAFLKAAEADRLHALYVLAITGGMRQGELFGLKRDDVDLDGGTVTVRRTLVHCQGEFIENAPKSLAGNRTVTLPRMAIDALRDHYKRMMVEGTLGAEYVFHTHSGEPLWRSNVRRKSLGPILKAAKLPAMRFHDLRHSSASILLASGENPKVVAQRLGHDVTMLMKTYAHVLPGMDKAAASKFDAMLGTGTAG